MFCVPWRAVIGFWRRLGRSGAEELLDLDQTWCLPFLTFSIICTNVVLTWQAIPRSIFFFFVKYFRHFVSYMYNVDSSTFMVKNRDNIFV